MDFSMDWIRLVLISCLSLPESSFFVLHSGEVLGF